MSGGELRLWMRERGLSAASLAEHLDVQERTVFRWRASQTLPPLVPIALEEVNRRIGSRKGAARG